MPFSTEPGPPSRFLSDQRAHASSDLGSLFPTLVLHDRPVFQEEYAAQLIMVRRLPSPPKGEYIRADLSMRFAFPLQPRRYDFGRFVLAIHAKAFEAGSVILITLPGDTRDISVVGQHLSPHKQV
jgi:hypothetical protein